MCGWRVRLDAIAEGQRVLPGAGAGASGEVGAESPRTVRPVPDDQWVIVAWLWQVFRHDLAPVVSGLRYADGRYQAVPLQRFPSPDGAGCLAWRSHPNTGEDAPMGFGFAVIEGLAYGRRSVTGFWVAPAVRLEENGRICNTAESAVY